MPEDHRRLLRELLARFERIEGADDHHLALAVGVSASGIPRWRKRLRSGDTIRLNDKTRDRIRSLLDPGSDPDGTWVEWALRKAKEEVQRYETAARVRRELHQQEWITPGDEGAVAQARETKERVGKLKTSRRKHSSDQDMIEDEGGSGGS